ncbi:N-acetylmuramyl-L-alanine amidase [Rubrobacter taiwanensis]|jgi:N-acetyl-anhydromuramyl-L-alanine amidase AmpD|uniref:N-acetylmuramoyl-L-alanine amidase n=1 Tax=Rubrobacter taiwanensis TaxID=185139 RepID=A0A4R1BSI5_9ACTN|nr:N-acetylmuramoyl-L-alanine amidase [Rubrobacter taiwanensis]TCJ20621.1 N-acetylmuramyl-L-alanine amidase [Rubrobacter taiwanensis]
MPRPDYQQARWYGAHSGNYSTANRPSSNPINRIVLHITEGSWSSAINWFNDSRAQVSAHYVVRSSDGFIGQCVEEKDIAWHAGNWPVNQTSIGIEHEGFGNDPKWMTSALYDSSARLSAYLCRKYNVPIRHAQSASEQGFLLHRQVTSTACPGRYFDIAHYLNRVRSYTQHRQVVDNANSNRFRASGAWGTSSYSSQRYGSDYRFANPSSNNDPAMFKIRIPRRGRYRIFAWWPALPGYNPRTPIAIQTASGWQRVFVNQRQNGGRWNLLGTFEMAAGDGWWIRIQRSSPQPNGGYVIADAVRVVEVV